MTLEQLTALVGLLCIVYVFVLIARLLKRNEDPREHHEVRTLVGVWMVLAIVLQLVAVFG